MNTSQSLDNSPMQIRRWGFFDFFAGLLLLGMGVLAGGAALRESVAIDEVAHIGAGVTYLQKFDLRFNPEHPPLPKILAALPLVLRGVHADYSHPSWKNAEQFFPAFLGEWVFGDWLLNKWNDPATTLAWARLPMLLLTLLLGWIVFIYARRLGGPWGGLLCLCVYVSTPTFLTFGPLVLTDLAVTLFSLLTVWRFADLWLDPSKKNTFWFALSFAGALLSKFTAGILLFVFVAIGLSARWNPLPGQPTAKPDARVWRKPHRRATLWGILWSALTVYTFYFVFSWNQPASVLERLGHGPGALLFRRLLMPPLLYFGGAAFVLIGGSRPTFLLGHAYSHGVWFYFPIVFVLKSSLGFLALLSLAVLAALVGKRRRAQLMKPAVPLEFATHWRALWVSLIVFTFFCLLSRLTISIRHFTIPMVLLILLLAPLPRMLGQLLASAPVAARLLAGLTAFLAASCLFSALRAYPYYFPYANAIASRYPLYSLMSDSNVDWNQSLPEVKRFADQHGLARIGMDNYGLSDATVIVPQSQFWDCQRPTASDEGQWVAISANMIQDGGNCLWLMQYPHETLGGSMYAVHLPEHIPPAGSPGGPPLPATFRLFAGAPFDVRVFFLYYIHHPEKIPRTNQEAGAAFSPENRAKIEDPSQFKAK